MITSYNVQIYLGTGRFTVYLKDKKETGFYKLKPK
jgi:hypothetical protein